jgi:hypothetical protein
MPVNANKRDGLLTLGGTLSIVAGIFAISNGVVLTAFYLTHGLIMPQGWRILFFLPGRVMDWWGWIVSPEWGGPPFWLMIAGVCFLVLGAIAVTGGISAIRARRFGLSLAGAICALAAGLWGLLAVIFVALARREFRGGVAAHSD